MKFGHPIKTCSKNSPNLHCDLINRIKVGDWVIDEERIQALKTKGFPGEVHAVVTYLVDNGQITSLQMYS